MPTHWYFCFLGDLLGKLLALISLAPFGIGSGFVALIMFRRDLHTVNKQISSLFCFY